MVEQEVVDNIRTVFDWHCTWIAFKDFGQLEEFVKEEGNEIFKIVCRVLRLEVRIHNDIYVAGQIISIPEFELASAIERHSLNASFRRNLNSRQLTPEDINLLIYSATWCQINPELE